MPGVTTYSSSAGGRAAAVGDGSGDGDSRSGEVAEVFDLEVNFMEARRGDSRESFWSQGPAIGNGPNMVGARGSRWMVSGRLVKRHGVGESWSSPGKRKASGAGNGATSVCHASAIL